ncbi:hypothetical protein J2Z79_003190 [Symbiobacterium terraclitae]|uniref:Uncharacterized protein n=1 Tax=Symbiobacterium terraclitae TaxID=557451 RepID=A0ABS4JW33_9FIRM|nr:hypothetical protein [Symbiobacterium terraclitae]
MDVIYLATPLATGLLAAAVAAVAALPGVARRPDVVLRTG